MSVRRSIMWPWLALGALLLCWAIYELVVAMVSATHAGTIAVSPYGRSEPRHVVAWPQAWAFVSGLVLMLWGGVSAIAEAAGFVHRVFIPSLLLIPCGFALVLFSAYLSDLNGIAYLVCFGLGMAFLFKVQRRYGKWTAIAAWSFVVASAVYWGYAV